MAEIDPTATQVYATGVAVAHGEMNNSDKIVRDRILAAMCKAVTDAQAEGVGDQDEIRRRILAARDAARG